MGFRKGQKEVMQYTEGKMAIPSVPGAGKTYTLANLAAKIIAQGMNKSGKILVLTVMNSAASNIKKRINKFLSKDYGIEGCKEFEVMTIHSFCKKIVDVRPDIVGLESDYSVIDEFDRNVLIKAAASQWRMREEQLFKSVLDIGKKSSYKINWIYNDWEKQFASIVSSSIQHIKSIGYSYKEIKEKISRLDRKNMLTWVADVYEIYDKMLCARGQVDFDDLLRFAKKILLNDENIKNEFHNKYTFVFEDEAQDSCIIQQDIINLITGDEGNYVRVGDCNQSIMGTFTTASMNLFKNFCSEDGVKKYTICQSGRNSRDIINLANYLVDWVNTKFDMTECKDALESQFIEPVDKDDPQQNPCPNAYTIAAKEYKCDEEEIKKVCANAKKSLEKNPDKSVAILAPTGYQVNNLSKQLEVKKTPYKIISGPDKERTKAIRTLGYFIDFIASPHINNKFIELLKDRIEDEDITNNWNQIISFLTRFNMEKIFYPENGNIDYDEIPENLYNTSEWQKLLDIVNLVKEIMEISYTTPEALILLIAEKLRFDKEKMAIAHRISSEIKNMMQFNPNWKLTDLASELGNTQSKFNYFINLVYDNEGFDVQKEKGKVILSTMHKSKGLEFDTVYIIGLDSSNFPTSLNDRFIGEKYYLKEEFQNPLAYIKASIGAVLKGIDNFDPVNDARLETIRERIRLLYVGITRARENLCLSVSKQFTTQYGRTIDKQPSQLFKVLQSKMNDERKKV